MFNISTVIMPYKSPQSLDFYSLKTGSFPFYSQLTPSFVDVSTK
jgi:hypothetical protein